MKRHVEIELNFNDDRESIKDTKIFRLDDKRNLALEKIEVRRISSSG
jgi:hypothetical protein